MTYRAEIVVFTGCSRGRDVFGAEDDRPVQPVKINSFTEIREPLGRGKSRELGADWGGDC